MDSCQIKFTRDEENWNNCWLTIEMIKFSLKGNRQTCCLEAAITLLDYYVSIFRLIKICNVCV